MQIENIIENWKEALSLFSDTEIDAVDKLVYPEEKASRYPKEVVDETK